MKITRDDLERIRDDVDYICELLNGVVEFLDRLDDPAPETIQAEGLLVNELGEVIEKVPVTVNVHAVQKVAK